jgi:hypothetical protein
MYNILFPEKFFFLYMFRMSHASIARSTSVVYSHRVLFLWFWCIYSTEQVLVLGHILGWHPVAAVQHTFGWHRVGAVQHRLGWHPVAAVQYTFGWHPMVAVQRTLGWHPVTAVQHTFTHKLYTEYTERNIYNNEKKKNWEMRAVPRLCELLYPGIWYDIYIYIYIYLTAVGLTPGGSSISHIYTQTTYNWGESMEKPQLG